MITVDINKTRENLKGFNEHIGIENLDTLLRKHGLLVKVHVGRARGTKKVNFKDLGISNEEVLKFMDAYFKDGEFNYIGLKRNKNFAKVESNLRKELRSRAIGYDGQFLTIPDYKDFKEVFEKEKVRYMKMRDEVCDDWDNIISEFCVQLKKSLKDLGCEDGVYQSILRSIPSREYYKNSFYMNISLRAFPVLETVDFFDSEIAELVQNSQKDELISCVHEITGNILSLAFSTLQNALSKCSDKGRVGYKTQNNILTTCDKLLRRNICGNEFVVNIVDNLRECHSLLEEKKFDDFLEFGEDVLIKIFGQLSELNLVSFLDFKNSMYSEDELTTLYNLTKGIFNNSNKKEMTF